MEEEEIEEGEVAEADDADSDDDDYSASTEVAISAAKSSPLLNISSDTVVAMSDADVSVITKQHAGLQLIERLILSSVQPAISGLQSQLSEAQTIIAQQAQAHEEIVNKFQQLQLATQQTSSQILELHNQSSNAELRQLAKEFRENRRAYDTAQADLEELKYQVNDEPTNNSLQRRARKAEELAMKLFADMRSVLQVLQQQCNSAGQAISLYINAEDANILTQTTHEWQASSMGVQAALKCC